MGIKRLIWLDLRRCVAEFWDGDVILRDVWPVRYYVRVFVVYESCCELNED